jgi:hypothetical protein
MDKFRAQAAARWLANAGVIELGFDSAAHFTADYRKAHAPPVGSTKNGRKRQPAG